MKNDFIPYARQSINSSDVESIAAGIQSPFITRGPLVEEFEDAVARYCGAKYAVAFNSGSTALHAAYHAAKVTRFDRLISTPNTYVATIGPGIQYYGATPYFCDIDLSTGNLDLSQLKPLLEVRSSRGRAIISPVHFGGIAVDMAALDCLIKDPETVIIEDASHAIGSFYPDGNRVGCCSYSQMTVFSFHPAKTITTGEGGMVTTNDATIYHDLRRFRNNGIENALPYLKKLEYRGYYEVEELTGNFNFTEFQAGLGLSQLERIENFVQQRRKLIRVYRSLLQNIPHITLFEEDSDPITAFHLCVAQIDFETLQTTRDKVMEALYDHGIGTQMHYIPVYRHPYFVKRYGDQTLQFPNMERYYAQALSLPLYSTLEEEQVERVVDTLLRVLQKGNGNFSGNVKFTKR